MNALVPMEPSQALAIARVASKIMDGSPEILQAKIMAGYELGLAPMASCRAVYTIQKYGGGIDVALMAQAKAALVYQRYPEAELHVEVIEQEDPKDLIAVGTFQRRPGGKVTRIQLSFSRARAKGLTDGKPGQMKKNWRMFPDRMLVARVTGWGVNQVWPEVTLAMPTYEDFAEELEPRNITPSDELPTMIEEAPEPVEPAKPKRTRKKKVEAIEVAPDAVEMPPLPEALDRTEKKEEVVVETKEETENPAPQEAEEAEILDGFLEDDDVEF